MMFQNKSYFTELFPWYNTKQTHVTLADGSSTAIMDGIGTIRFTINNKFPVEFHNVLFVPSLSSNLFSVKEFLRYKGTLLLAENTNFILAFPSFITDTTISNEITIQTNNTNQPPIFSTIDAPLHTPNSTHYISPTTLQQFIPHVYHIPTKKIAKPIAKPPSPTSTHTQNKKHQTSPNSTSTLTTPPTSPSPPTSSDNTPSSTITSSADTPSSTINDSTLPPQPSTNLSTNAPPNSSTTIEPTTTSTTPTITAPATSLPSWLHHDSKITIKLENKNSFMKGILLKKLDDTYIFHVGRSRRTGTNFPITHTKLLSLFNHGHILRGHTHLIRALQSLPSSSNAYPTDTQMQRPTLPTEHKPISSWPSTTSFTCDQLRKAFGFRNIDSILPQIQSTSQNNFSISTKDKETILDLGDVATIHRSKRNTNPLPLPHTFGEIMHMGIIFGTVTAIEGHRYGLFIADRATRSRFILPMKILKNDLLPTFQKFCNDIGIIPKRIITDFDHKLMGQKVIDHFSDSSGNTIFETATPPPKIEAAPPNKQNQNGLAESNWKAILQMARAWLSSHLLPSKFWWYALKRATEISNYIPIKINDTTSTPFELAYGSKPDLRFLLPMFSVSYLSRYKDGNISRKTYILIALGQS